MGQLQQVRKNIKQVRKNINDDRLKCKINDLLCAQHFPSFKTLNVEVDHGLVTISGTLQSYYHRQVALSTCQQLADVITVIDMMSVRE